MTRSLHSGPDGGRRVCVVADPNGDAGAATEVEARWLLR